METLYGKGSPIVNQPTGGVSTLEMDITEAFKSANLHGIHLEMVGSQIIPIVQNGEIRLKLLVEFKEHKDGTLGPLADTTQACDSAWHSHPYQQGNVGCCPKCNSNWTVSVVETTQVCEHQVIKRTCSVCKYYE